MFDTSSDEDDPRNRPSSADPNHEITRRLKAYYASVEEEPIPERFIELLEKLDEAEKAQSPGGSGNDS
ncbi:MAG: NepR family anti-sigma factor [Tepidamorphaceae bacterium]|nr:hypothetical protein [Rhodobiaceae bacterium]MCC0049326.1 hypothetical protein [Rhodobiaceae bacterium]